MRLTVLQSVLALVTLLRLSTASADDRCQPAIEFPATLREQHVVIFGEIHGTSETPALVAEYACSLAQQGEQVVVALEIPANEQSRIDAYLDGTGSDAARRELLGGIFWSGQDGRSSAAMFNLVERIRELRASGDDLAVIAFDALIGITRDAAMADRLLSSIEQAPSKKFVVLVGNLHAMKSVGGPIYEPMAHHLERARPVSLNVDFLEGSAWNCSGTCGIHALYPKSEELRRPPGVHMGYSLLPGFDGTVFLPAAMPSVPARTVVLRDDG